MARSYDIEQELPTLKDMIKKDMFVDNAPTRDTTENRPYGISLAMSDKPLLVETVNKEVGAFIRKHREVPVKTSCLLKYQRPSCLPPAHHFF